MLPTTYSKTREKKITVKDGMEFFIKKLMKEGKKKFFSQFAIKKTNKQKNFALKN